MINQKPPLHLVTPTTEIKTDQTDQTTPIIVDPGQVVTITVGLGEATRISFSYLPPGCSTAIHDSKFGSPDSPIEQVVPGIYRRLIDTRKMRGGIVWWYFLGENDEHPEKQQAKSGSFIVRDFPSTLLGLEELSKPNLSLKTQYLSWITGVVCGAFVTICVIFYFRRR